MGWLSLGQAVSTGPGRFPGAKVLIHVAVLNMAWRATARSAQLSTRNAVGCAIRHGAQSMVLP